MEWIVKSSTQTKKLQFFLVRFITYFSIFLLPIWLQKSIHSHFIANYILLLIYSFFTMAQWFLLSKEVDNRLKIYFKTQSSLDRVTYRILTGLILMIVYYNILSLLSPAWVRNFYWGSWAVFGLFYSWPTRGKIIEETLSRNFSEFKFLDGFEKTALYLIMLVAFISLPTPFSLGEYSHFETLSFTAMQTVDIYSQVSSVWWNFLWVLHTPFHRFPELMLLGYTLQTYLYGVVFLLLCSYVLFRYLFSRRMSLLGIFAFISSWSVFKATEQSVLTTMSSAVCIAWLWSCLWGVRSSSYRIGFFWGLMSFWATIVDIRFSWLGLIMLAVGPFYLFRGQSYWFKMQVLKYMLFGSSLAFIVVFDSVRWGAVDWAAHFFPIMSHGHTLLNYLSQKSFLLIAPVGMLFFLYRMFFPSSKSLNQSIQIKDSKRVMDLLVLCVMGWVLTLALMPTFFSGLSLLWVLIVFSVLPLEAVLESQQLSRAQKNGIYIFYILICLLDSSLEVRLKQLIQNF